MVPIRRWVAVFLICCLSCVSVGAVSGSSPWAEEELTRAEAVGLIFPGMENMDARNEISRQEFSYIAVMLYGLISGKQINLTYSSPFTDCSDPYVSFAAHLGIVKGVGGSLFSPGSPIRKQDLAVMLARVLNMCGIDTESYSATLFKDHYDISGYAQIAVYFLKSRGILKGDLQNCCQPLKSIPIEEAVILALRTKETFFPKAAVSQQGIQEGGMPLSMGMSAQELKALFGAPAETLDSGRGFDWYVYPMEECRQFFMAGISKDRLVAFYAQGSGFSVDGIRAGYSGKAVVGDQLEKYKPTFYTDPFDMDRVYAIQIIDPAYADLSYDTFPAKDFSRAIFLCTNAFRAYHGVAPLIWSESAAKAASYKSTDMARNNYFNHLDLNGYGADHLLTSYGIKWSSCGENLAAGQADGIAAIAAWVESKGHRTTMLNSSFIYLGVGSAFDKNSFYRSYYTQEYFAS